MLKEERFDFILKELKSSSKVLLEELAVKLGISEDTVRRDIHALHKAGLLNKVRGGAIRVNLNPLAFQDRTDSFNEGKQVIALKARQVLQNARTVFMDGGTTVLAVAAALPIDSTLRIVTNNMSVIPILSNHKNVEIIVLGGTYNKLSNTTLGTQTCMEILRYQADVYLMGICSIDSETGISASILEEGETKKAFIKSAAKTVILGHQEKLGTVDFYKVASISEVDTLITDLPSDSPLLDNFRNTGLEIF
jgi:DeoR/GlpR family transcriptional regulator of sugar metabolism